MSVCMYLSVYCLKTLSYIYEYYVVLENSLILESLMFSFDTDIMYEYRHT